MKLKSDREINKKLTSVWFLLRKKQMRFLDPIKKNKPSKSLLISMVLLIGLFYSLSSNAAECATAGGSWESNGIIYRTYSMNSETDCSNVAILSSAEYARLKVFEEQNSQFTAITGEMASASFMFGMTGYLIFWFIGFKGRMARKLVKQI